MVPSLFKVDHLIVEIHTLSWSAMIFDTSASESAHCAHTFRFRALRASPRPLRESLEMATRCLHPSGLRIHYKLTPSCRETLYSTIDRIDEISRSRFFRPMLNHPRQTFRCSSQSSASQTSVRRVSRRKSTMGNKSIPVCFLE
jgi:hypothetical protein